MAVALAGLLVSIPGPVGAEEGPAMIGNKACSECHDEMAAAFPASLHAKAWGASARFAGAGCESCHGPGGAHQKDQTRSTIVSFTRGTARSAAELSAQCLGCHGSSDRVALWDTGAHRKNDVACTSCHTIHGSTSPLPSQPEVCFGCHRNVKFEVGKRSHHPVLEGKVLCSNCHDPHGTMTPRLLKAESVNELCYGCHADKRGPFIWEHAPVEENCVICHSPHGSRQAKLLVKKVPNLCQECHDWSRHPGTAYDASTAFTGRAPSNRSYGRSCMNCHSSIHGSWAPANPDNGENAGDVWMR
jgi:DmsE family decaheme c-type cytochrome